MKKIFIFLSLLGVCTLGFTQKKSPYITKVFEYRPAPGQFINEMPLYEKGDTKERMVQKVQNCIQGDTKILISLGGYGGYLIFGFDHLVQNVEGKNDFKIWGNAFYAGTNPNSGASKEGGSCEPGIVWVAYDANGDGLPNDTWYELAGSEYYKSETLKAYQITYYKPDENKIRIPDPLYPFLNDTTYIRWTSNQATQGYIYRNTFHDQSYYPNWIEEDSLSFCGTKLADNQIDESGNGSYFVQYAYPWGYADNHPNTDVRAGLDIGWAVDSNGNPFKLEGIHFVKVYTGVNQYCGWLGETSTEIMGAEDLHLSNIVQDSVLSIVNLNSRTKPQIYPNPFYSILNIVSPQEQSVQIYNSSGKLMRKTQLNVGKNTWDLSFLPCGIYILKTEQEYIKIIKVNN